MRFRAIKRNDLKNKNPSNSYTNEADGQRGGWADSVFGERGGGEGQPAAGINDGAHHAASRHARHLTAMLLPHGIAVVLVAYLSLAQVSHINAYVANAEASS